jgi:hypothetical protein
MSNNDNFVDAHTVTIGKIKDETNVDNIKKFVIDNYAADLKNRPSLHKYINKLPVEFQDMVEKIRNSKEIKDAICKQYEECHIDTLPDTDELYISHYNKDGGGDQGLFDKHYDGVLRFISSANIVRALVYINSTDEYVVHFLDSNVSHNFKTYEFGILDFNKEYHYVEGKYDKDIDINDTRILLKINYIVCPECSMPLKKSIIFLNSLVFYIVKASMEYSKNPETISQKIIGFFCNFFRHINNISVYLTLFVVCILFGLCIASIYFLGKYISNIHLQKNIKKLSRLFNK